MKRKYDEGFSLVEVLVAMAILAAVVIPVCSGMLTAYRMNAKTDEMMQAQLAVSSAVESLMAEGISKASDTYDINENVDRFPDVTIKTEAYDSYTFKVTVSDNGENVTVTTYIRAGGGTG